MKQKQKPLSFSLHPDNIAYIEAAVLKQKESNHRYSRSMYLDDLITHLRTKAKPKTELVVNDKKPVKRFVPPGKLEVETYMLERGVHISKNSTDEAEKFCDHFESNGWKVGGKTKMVSWKAAVRNWLKGNSNDNRQNNANVKGTGQKKSAVERVNERNNLKYGQPDERGLGVGSDGGYMGRTVDEGKRGRAIEHVGDSTFTDY